MKLYEEGVRDYHFIDSESGALIFPKTKSDKVSEENEKLKTLLLAMAAKMGTEGLPKEALEALGYNGN